MSFGLRFNSPANSFNDRRIVIYAVTAAASGNWLRRLDGRLETCRAKRLAFVSAIVLLIVGGAFVATISDPPLKYDEFNKMLVVFLISLAVGISAGLANSDDVGRREFLGLAATAQIAIVPVWFGISFIFGFPNIISQEEITTRALGFGLNILTLIVASLATYVLLGATSRRLVKATKE